MLIIEFGVGIDRYKNRRIRREKFINGPQIATDIDTAITYILSMELVIVK
jgi:hypothetical protein